MSATLPGELSTQVKVRRAFSETADPAAYVPRASTESVLSEFETWAAENGTGSTIVALVARPGFGKTFLLRVFESRLAADVTTEDRRRGTLYLPYAGLSTIDLCEWIHGLLGHSIRLPESPEDALRTLLDLADGPKDPFVLLIDDADSMPPETIRALVEGLPQSHSPLRIMLALNDDAKASRLLATLDPLHPRLVRLQQPMSKTETAAYLDARMKWAELENAEIARVDAEAIGKIHTLSGGVPRRVHMIAVSLFEAGGMGLPDELDAKERRENWMGRPIEDDF